MSAPGMPVTGPASPSGLDDPTAGAEAVAQNQVAKDGLAALERVQALNGARPEASDLKALLQYVLAEGLGAPQAQEMVAILQQYGVQVPGANQNQGEE